MAVKFPQVLYARVANVGDEDNEFLASSPDISELSDEVIEQGSVKVARYVLAGEGVIHQVAPRYVEDAKA